MRLDQRGKPRAVHRCSFSRLPIKPLTFHTAHTLDINIGVGGNAFSRFISFSLVFANMHNFLFSPLSVCCERDGGRAKWQWARTFHFPSGHGVDSDGIFLALNWGGLRHVYKKILLS